MSGRPSSLVMWPAVKSRISPFSTFTRLQRIGPVVRPQRDAHRGGFERRPAGVDDEGVVAEEAERGHVAGRSERVRDIVGTADNAGLGDAVHMGLVRGLQRRLAAEGILRFIGAAVGDDDDVFHAGSVRRGGLRRPLRMCSR